MQGIEQALRNGCKLHSFRSGGGLRVFRLENAGDLVGYGEHYNAEEAIRRCDEDYLAGGRPYEDVYGKIYPHYLTGTTEASSNVDRWLLRGGNVDAVYENGKFKVFDEFVRHIRVPKSVIDKVLRDRKPVEWEYHNRKFVSTLSWFPNGEASTSTRCIHCPDGLDDWSEPAIIAAEGDSFVEALAGMEKAIHAEIQEQG